MSFPALIHGRWFGFGLTWWLLAHCYTTFMPVYATPDKANRANFHFIDDPSGISLHIHLTWLPNLSPPIILFGNIWQPCNLVLSYYFTTTHLPTTQPTCMSSLSHLIKNYWKVLTKTEKHLDILKGTVKDCLTISPAPIFPRLRATCFTCSLSHFLFKAHWPDLKLRQIMALKKEDNT